MDFAKSDWKSVRRAAASDGVALIPMGSLEAHGPHLPCGTDTCLVNEMVRRSVAKTNQPDRVVVFPTVEYSLVEWARPFASAGISPKTLLDKLVHIGKAALDIGFGKIAFCQGHGNLPAAQLAMWQLRYERCYAMYVDIAPYDMQIEQIEQLTGEAPGHAGTLETSMMLICAPELVDMSKAVDGPNLWGDDFPYPSARGRAGVFCIPTVEVLPDSVEGCATKASAEIGEKVFDIYSSEIAKILKELLAKPVPEEYLREFIKPLD